MNCGVRNACESDLRSNLRMLSRYNSVRKFLGKDFFIAFLTENLNFPWSSRVPKYSLREEERTNQSAKIYPKTTLPYSCKYIYIYEKMIVNISLRMPPLDLITQHYVVNVEFEYFFLPANGITGQEIRSIPAGSNKRPPCR